MKLGISDQELVYRGTCTLHIILSITTLLTFIKLICWFKLKSITSHGLALKIKDYIIIGPLLSTVDS